MEKTTRLLLTALQEQALILAQRDSDVAKERVKELGGQMAALEVEIKSTAAEAAGRYRDAVGAIFDEHEVFEVPEGYFFESTDDGHFFVF